MLAFLIQPARAACPARSGGVPFFFRYESLGNQISHFFTRVFEVVLLISRALAADLKFAVSIEFIVGEARQSFPAFRIHSLNSFQIDQQYNLGGDLIDVLAPRS